MSYFSISVQVLVSIWKAGLLRSFVAAGMPSPSHPVYPRSVPSDLVTKISKRLAYCLRHSLVSKDGKRGYGWISLMELYEAMAPYDERDVNWVLSNSVSWRGEHRFDVVRRDNVDYARAVPQYVSDSGERTSESTDCHDVRVVEVPPPPPLPPQVSEFTPFMSESASLQGCESEVMSGHDSGGEFSAREHSSAQRLFTQVGGRDAPVTPPTYGPPVSEIVSGGAFAGESAQVVSAKRHGIEGGAPYARAASFSRPAPSLPAPPVSGLTSDWACARECELGLTAKRYRSAQAALLPPPPPSLPAPPVSGFAPSVSGAASFQACEGMLVRQSEPEQSLANRKRTQVGGCHAPPPLPPFPPAPPVHEHVSAKRRRTEGDFRYAQAALSGKPICCGANTSVCTRVSYDESQGGVVEEASYLCSSCRKQYYVTVYCAS